MIRGWLIPVFGVHFFLGFLCADPAPQRMARPMECCAAECRMEVPKEIAAASCAAADVAATRSLKGYDAAHAQLSLPPGPLAAVVALVLPAACAVEPVFSKFSAPASPLYLLNTSLLL